MAKATFLTGVPLLPGSSVSVLGGVLQQQPRQPVGTQVPVPKSKFPLNYFEGLPVVTEDESLNGLGPCGETSVRAGFRIPDDYLDDPNMGGIVIQKMTMAWIISDCITGGILSKQPMATFWEAFDVREGQNGTHTFDEWWLKAPPAGDGTFGSAFWQGTAAYFPGKTVEQCGFAKKGEPGAHHLAGEIPSSRTRPECWGRGPLPESNAAVRTLFRNWFCCPGYPVIDQHSHEVLDISNRWTLPEQVPLPDTLIAARPARDGADNGELSRLPLVTRARLTGAVRLRRFGTDSFDDR